MTTATILPSSSSSSLPSQQKDYYYSNFKNSIKASETLKSYNYRLGNYMKYRNYTEHSQLIESKDIKVIENEVIEFLVYLKEKGYSLGSQKGYLNAINHFYEINDVRLNRKKIKRFLGDLTTTEDIQEDKAHTSASTPFFGVKMEPKLLLLLSLLLLTNASIPNFVIEGSAVKVLQHLTQKRR